MGLIHEGLPVPFPDPPLTKQQLIDYLQLCAGHYDEEVAHIQADRALLAYINDPDITAAFDSFNKWYA